MLTLNPGSSSMKVALLASLEQLKSRAPNHQPLSLAVTREVRRLLLGVPVVACFDTTEGLWSPRLVTPGRRPDPGRAVMLKGTSPRSRSH